MRKTVVVHCFKHTQIEDLKNEALSAILDTNLPFRAHTLTIAWSPQPI